MAANLNLQLKCDVAKSARPKVLVVSHERSGTHFLINSLALNLGYVNKPWLNVDFELGLNFFSPCTFESFFSTLRNHWILNVAKSHHEFGFYQGWLSNFRDEFRVLYIVRDVLDVMKSYHRFLQDVDWFEGPKVTSLEQFLRTEPIGAMTRFQRQPATDMVQRWSNHVSSWISGGLELGPEMFKLIHYSKLDSKYEETVQEIATFLGIECTGKTKRPDRNTDVVMPCRSPKRLPLHLSHAGLEYLDRRTEQTIAFLQQHFPS